MHEQKIKKPEYCCERNQNLSSYKIRWKWNNPKATLHIWKK